MRTSHARSCYQVRLPIHPLFTWELTGKSSAMVCLAQPYAPKCAHHGRASTSPHFRPSPLALTSTSLLTSNHLPLPLPCPLISLLLIPVLGAHC